MMRRRLWILLLAAAVTTVVLKLQWAHGVAWDEVEFYRATKWLAEGRVPFRDFFEHHLPVQWFLFAPVAFFVDSPGVGAILIMRWAQALLWICAFVVLHRMTRDAGADREGSLLAIVVLLASPLFADLALEYRVDVPANLAYLAALFVAFRAPRSRAAWIGFGALMSLSVLTNLRMVYLVIATGALLLFVDARERRWRFNAVALWMTAGIAAVGAAFGAWLAATHALAPFRAAMELNVSMDRVLAAEAHTLVPVLLRPFTSYDLAATALLVAGLAGSALALREIRRPGSLQLLAILAVLSVLSLTLLGVHYPYHLQLSLLLFVAPAAAIVRGVGMQRAALVVAGVALCLQLASFTRPGTGVALRYQDKVMREADRRTLPNERVWDGVGSALRRPPAYRYWFLPSIVRLAAQRRLIEPYGAMEMIAAPPAAIVHSVRVYFWFQQFPSAAAYATTHYVPLYRDLWVPGLSAKVEPRRRVSWIVPRGGRYRLVASELLPKHPWFYNPTHYAMAAGSDAVDFQLPLDRLPQVDRARLAVAIDGHPVNASVFTLRKGGVISVESSLPETVGVLIVPADVTTLFMAPEAPVVM
ncbi:MAG: glycosyltransferase family 39 protein [Acidobacteria bacterium]|nr:glycosyltransferase family 39 protein [Acidobacteriota bacterium]